MPPLKEILDRKKEVSGQVSSQTRTLALGMLAISWALLTASDDPLKSMAKNVDHALLLGLAVLSVVVLALDFMQYVFATDSAKEAAERAEASEKKAAGYDRNSSDYKLQAICYKGKFWALAAAVLLLAIVFVLLFRAPVKEEAKGGVCGGSVGRVVRLAELEINPAQLEAYRSALKEEIAASVHDEPGVVTLYAVSVKDHPEQVRLFEMYCSAEAYAAHRESAHFKRYKSETQAMVKSLKLTETEPLVLGSKLR